MLDSALQHLAALGLATGVARTSVVYALVSASHMLGIALLLGPITLVDLRLLGLFRALDLPAISILRRTAIVGVALLLPTGLLLFSAKPLEYAGNPAMQAKLIAVSAGLANALSFEWRVRRAGLAGAMDGWPAALFGAASLMLWLCALWLGRWIAFV